MTARPVFKSLRRFSTFVLVLLVIEFLDEFVFGAREAAWPLIRTDLGLNYFQIGALLSLPNLIGNLIEPALFILGDLVRPDGRGLRRWIILGGGLAFCLALFLTALSHSYLLLLLSFILFSPASGAFVSLSQAALMDSDPERHEQNMARWTFAGSLGVVAGPLALGLDAALNLGWRSLFLFFAVLTLLPLVAARRFPFLVIPRDGQPQTTDFLAGVRNAWDALRRGEVLRWLVLLEFSDLMLDVLYGFLALYFVDVVRTTPLQASLSVAMWTGFGLLGDFLLIPLLERVRGLDYLRVSTILEMILLPAFLLAPAWEMKLVLLAFLGLFNAGWYALLKAGLFSAMPGRSSTSIAVNNLSGLVGSLIPLGLGWVAQRYNLQATMWLLLMGPLVLWVGLPRNRINNSKG